MLHNDTVNRQDSVTTTTLTAFDTETPITEQPEAVSAQQVYKQSLEKIWENVSQLPEGQNTVVLSQLWALGKTANQPTASDFPALAAYGFIQEQSVEDGYIWNPVTPYLKDFWRVGIRVSNAYGYALQNADTFQSNLQSRIHAMFS